MPIPMTCPSCSKRLNAPDDAAGRRAKCPQCDTQIAIPGAAMAPPLAPAPRPKLPVPRVAEQAVSVTRRSEVVEARVVGGPIDVSAPSTKECPFCSEQILATAKKCKHCGETLDVALRAAEEAKRAAAAPVHAPSIATAQNTTMVVNNGRQYRFPHFIHLVLTLLTLGLRLPIWILHYVFHRLFG